MKYGIVTLVTLALVGCQTVAMKTPGSITFDNVMAGMNEQETADEAQAHCRKQGKNAVYIPDAFQDGRITFQCR